MCDLAEQVGGARFWSIIGAAVVGATVGVVAATAGGTDRMPHGEVGHISID